MTVALMTFATMKDARSLGKIAERRYMQVITKASLVSSVAEAYAGLYNLGLQERREEISPFGMRLSRKRQYELLKVALTEDDVEAIVGNRTWTRNRCSECGRDCNLVVQLGEEPDYESETAQICLGCLERAVSLAKEQR